MLAYFDSFAGIVPVRVESMVADESSPGGYRFKVRATAARGAYVRGQSIEANGLHVIPRPALYKRRGGSWRILPYNWADFAADAPKPERPALPVRVLLTWNGATVMDARASAVVASELVRAHFADNFAGVALGRFVHGMDGGRLLAEIQALEPGGRAKRHEYADGSGSATAAVQRLAEPAAAVNTGNPKLDAILADMLAYQAEQFDAMCGTCEGTGKDEHGEECEDCGGTGEACGDLDVSGADMVDAFGEWRGQLRQALGLPAPRAGLAKPEGAEHG